MQLQAGKTYKARNGQVFEDVNSDNHPMCALWTSKNALARCIQPHWHDDGKIGSGLTWTGLYDDSFDLVEEVTV